MNVREIHPLLHLTGRYGRNARARASLAIAGLLACWASCGKSSPDSDSDLRGDTDRAANGPSANSVPAQAKPDPAPNYPATKIRFLVVSSYHREYLWSQDTSRGFSRAMLDHGYFESDAQSVELAKRDRVETKRAIVRKLWMDTKRHGDVQSIAAAVASVRVVVDEFRPDIMLLGDDNAVHYIGNQYLDTERPIVFWGVNGLPGKYGLVDSLDRPGHNVTGIYQKGYLKECLVFLKKITPNIATMAVLSDDSPTGRAKVKALESLSRQGKLPVMIVAAVVTNSARQWKQKAQKLAKKVDAFFVLNHNTLQDEAGKPVDPMKLGAWYLRNVKKPDCGHERQFAIEGILATADDSGHNQAYEAVRIAHDILANGAKPATIPVRAPGRGPLIVNRQRAAMLGIEITENMGAEDYVDTALALERYPR